MGMTYVEGKVRGPRGERTLEFLVDSGATYTLLPNETWRALGLVADQTLRFTLADGTHVERGISECYITLPQGGSHTRVILVEPGDKPLLGVFTLEGLGLMLNPFSRELVPMLMRL